MHCFGFQIPSIPDSWISRFKAVSWHVLWPTVLRSQSIVSGDSRPQSAGDPRNWDNTVIIHQCKHCLGTMGSPRKSGRSHTYGARPAGSRSHPNMVMVPPPPVGQSSGAVLSKVSRACIYDTKPASYHTQFDGQPASQSDGDAAYLPYCTSSLGMLWRGQNIS